MHRPSRVIDYLPALENHPFKNQNGPRNKTRNNKQPLLTGYRACSQVALL